MATAQDHKLDNLASKLKKDRRCECCGAPAVHVHHIIPRANRLLRWDVMNLIPLCAECHRRIHDKDKYLIIAPAREKYLQKMKNKDFKDYLLQHNLTKEEFFKLKEQALREAIK